MAEKWPDNSAAGVNVFHSGAVVHSPAFVIGHPEGLVAAVVDFGNMRPDPEATNPNWFSLRIGFSVFTPEMTSVAVGNGELSNALLRFDS